MEIFRLSPPYREGRKTSPHTPWLGVAVRADPTRSGQWCGENLCLACRPDNRCTLWSMQQISEFPMKHYFSTWNAGRTALSSIPKFTHSLGPGSRPIQPTLTFSLPICSGAFRLHQFEFLVILTTLFSRSRTQVATAPVAAGLCWSYHKVSVVSDSGHHIWCWQTWSSYRGWQTGGCGEAETYKKRLKEVAIVSLKKPTLRGCWESELNEWMNKWISYQTKEHTEEELSSNEWSIAMLVINCRTAVLVKTTCVIAD